MRLPTSLSRRTRRVAAIEIQGDEPRRRLLLSLPGRDRLERALRYLLDAVAQADRLSRRSASLGAPLFAKRWYPF